MFFVLFQAKQEEEMLAVFGWQSSIQMIGDDLDGSKMQGLARKVKNEKINCQHQIHCMGTCL